MQLTGASSWKCCSTFGITLVAFVLCWSAPNQADARSLLIYYANETVPEILDSRNYQALLSVLDGMQNQIGFAAAEDLRSDTQTFRAKVFKDVNSLRNAAQSGAIDLAVFTNTLVLQSKYMVVRSGTEESRPFSNPRSAYDPVTEYSPLSSRTNFGFAMIEALREYTDKDEIILIVNSHGSEKFAVVPRVAADFTSVSAETLRQQLENQQGDDLELQSAELRGIKKADLWKELDSATQAAHVNLALVFLETCASAASSWNEYFSIPSTVSYVAHSGFRPISLEQFDYTLLSEWEQRAHHDQLHLLSEFLRKSGVIYFDSKYTYWRWPLLVTATSMPKIIYFAPLGIWLFVSLLVVWRTSFPHAETRK
jgi:hypothetical protein